jgi:hypothetical protein
VKHFGFQRSRTFRAGKPNQFVDVKLGLVRLELYSSDSANVDQKGGEQGVGFEHLSFDAPKLELAIESLRADRIEPDPIEGVREHVPVVGSFLSRSRRENYRVHRRVIRTRSESHQRRARLRKRKIVSGETVSDERSRRPSGHFEHRRIR